MWIRSLQDTSRWHGFCATQGTNLGLSVGPEPTADSVLADLSELEAQLGGQNVGQGHQLRGLISGIAEHVPLVTGTDVLQGLGVHAVHGLANVRGLLLNVDQHLREQDMSCPCDELDMLWLVTRSHYLR